MYQPFSYTSQNMYGMQVIKHLGPWHRLPGTIFMPSTSDSNFKGVIYHTENADNYIDG